MIVVKNIGTALVRIVCTVLAIVHTQYIWQMLISMFMVQKIYII